MELREFLIKTIPAHNIVSIRFFNRVTRIIKFSKNSKKQPTISSADLHYSMSITGCQVKSSPFTDVFSIHSSNRIQPVCLSAYENNTWLWLCQAIYSRLLKNISHPHLKSPAPVCCCHLECYDWSKFGSGGLRPLAKDYFWLHFWKILIVLHYRRK